MSFKEIESTQQRREEKKAIVRPSLKKRPTRRET